MITGFVCDKCDWLNSSDSPDCVDCGTALKKRRSQEENIDAAAEPAPPVTDEPATPPPAEPPAEPTPAPATTEPADHAEPQPAAAPPPEQAAPAAAGGATCPQCGVDTIPNMRFCGACGCSLDDAPAAEPAAAPGANRTLFFGAMQTPNRARLILIKGEGVDGLSYHLNATEHYAGRVHGEICFADDTLLSPRHACFFYDNDRLMVRDEQSANGVFVRIKGEYPLHPGTHFLVGEQLLRFELIDGAAGQKMLAAADGTYFYGSPPRPGCFRLIQILRGGHVGMVYRAPVPEATLGRDGNDINFPDDPFISGRHALVRSSGEQHALVDLGSKNGTFIRIDQPIPLNHGDYVFLGQQLMRVEIT